MRWAPGTSLGVFCSTQSCANPISAGFIYRIDMMMTNSTDWLITLTSHLKTQHCASALHMNAARGSVPEQVCIRCGTPISAIDFFA
jgi:hypothetical protein